MRESRSEVENRIVNYFLLPNNYIKLETYQHRTFSH